MKKQIKVNANEKSYMNLSSEKGHGQVINRGKLLGWEMNVSLYGEDGNIQYFPTKTEAKKALIEKL